jgi:hypothetical protein
MKKVVKKTEIEADKAIRLLQELNSPLRMREQAMKKYCLAQAIAFYSDKAVTEKELFGLAKEICEYVYDDSGAKVWEASRRRVAGNPQSGNGNWANT